MGFILILFILKILIYICDLLSSAEFVDWACNLDRLHMSLGYFCNRYIAAVDMGPTK